MNITLVNPATQPGTVTSGRNSMYPFSLLFLSNYLYKNGYKAKILDLSTSADPLADLKRYLKNRGADIIGFTGTTENRFLVWDMITSTRGLLPKAKIVAGGSHFTYTADETLKAIPEIDAIVRREGEITFLELVKAFDNEGGLDDLPGISYRKDNMITHNPDRPYEKDIDKFIIQEDILDDIILPCGNYSPFMLMRNYEEDEIKTLPIHAGRGCPGRCVFCIYNKWQYRARSVDSVLQEIKRKKIKYNCNKFHLQDPHLLKRPGFIKEFCARLSDERIGIQWYAETRADIDLELLDLMSKSGCISLDFGIETASEGVLTSIKKGIKLEQAERLIKKCAEFKIKILVFTMVSLPDEKEEDALKTLKFLKSFRRSITNFTGAVTRIYPGTELEKMAKARGVLKQNFSWYDRDYKNGAPDLVAGHIPLWIEHLSPKFIRFCTNEIQKMSLSRKSIHKLILRDLPSFLTKWSMDDIRRKWRKFRALFKFFYYKFFYFGRAK